MGRIVHFGLGNFARAHLLDYTQDAGGWDVVGVSLRSPTIRDALMAQDFMYDLCIQGAGPKRITVLKDVLVAPESPRAVIDAMQEADIISATVTEKGYHLTSEEMLDQNDPIIQSDLRGHGPHSLIGFLAHGLSQRLTPVTVMSCDNRVENGATLKAAVKKFAELKNLEIDWSLLSFPNAMVDRITPATTDAVRAITGDAMAVPTEQFREWVIEDDFTGPRPDWPDVQFVSDVAPHELRKLRMLNGAHSLLAYAGLAKGHDYVHQAIHDLALRPIVERLMTQAALTLPDAVQGLVHEYKTALIRRFENPDLAHSLRQIAMDGSQKVPYRFLGTIRDLRASGQDADALIYGIRAWLAFCISEDSEGRQIDDPLAREISTAVQHKSPRTTLLELVGASDLLPMILND